MDDCTHPSGDMVNGYWLCGHCYAKLPERPSRLVMEKGKISDSDTPPPPRQMVVHAPIAMAGDMSLATFVEIMARRLIAQTGGSFTMPDATDYAVEILRNLDEPFGSPDLDWSQAGAWELVYEDMQCWDCEGERGNG